MKPIFMILLCVALTACSGPKEEAKVSDSKPAADSGLAAQIRQFAPTEIAADTAHLSEGDRQALSKLIEAARLLDPLFYRQV